MSFVAETKRSLDVPPDVAFDRMANHASWWDWMPESFRPVGRSKGPLRKGTALKVKIAGMPLPATVVVSVARRPDEIAWTGGVPGVLWAEHRFIFETRPGGTTVRSVEIWRGALAPVLRRAIQPQAERIGAEQLAGLERGVKQTA